MKSFCCSVCGGGELIKQDYGMFRCSNCDTLFYEEALRADEQALRSAVDSALYEKECENIAKLRRNLWELVHAEFVDSYKIVGLCRAIQNKLPNDFLSEFYEVACENGYKKLIDFLDGIDVEAHYVYIDEVLEFAVKLLKPETLLAVSNLIARAYESKDVNKFRTWCDRFSSVANQVEDGIFDVTLSRDVFVAYKSEDWAKVEELVSYLENKEGLTCFVSARNLQHGKILDYEKLLKTAMDNCSVLVFVSSRRSRKTGDARNIELKGLRDAELDNGPPEYKVQNNYKGLPKKYKKPRVEYVIEGYANTAAEKFVAEFFAGYERQTTVKDVAERIFEQLDAGVSDEKGEKFTAGEEYYKSKKYDLAYAAFRSAAELGHAEAKRYLGDMYYYGYGVAQSYADAIDWYEQAAIGGSSVAKVRADSARKAEANRLTRERKAQEASAREAAKAIAKVERLKSETHTVVAKTKQKPKSNASRASMGAKLKKAVKKLGNKLSDKLLVISIICAVLGTAMGLFAYIFPIKYLLIYENYSAIFYGLTITGLALDVIAVVTFFAFALSEAWEWEQYIWTIVIASILTVVGLVAILVGSLNGSIFGWGIAFISIGGVALVVQVIAAIYAIVDGGEFEQLQQLPVTFAYFFAIMALFGIAYSETKQIKAHYNGELGIYYYVRDDNALTVFFEDYGDGDIEIPSYIGNSRVAAVGRPKYVKKNDSLKRVILPNTLQYIEDGAFRDCSNLADIRYYAYVGETASGFSQGVLSIGDYAFGNCISLKAIELNDSLTAVGDKAFYGCSELQSITFNENITSIGASAFENCIALKSVTIPGTVNRVSDYSFRGCSILSSVVISDGVAAVGTGAFENCVSLAEVGMPSTVNRLGDNAFANCRMLKTIYVPAVDYVGGGCFGGCDALTIYCALDDYPSHKWYQSDSYSGLSGKKVVWKSTPQSYAEAIKNPA